MFGSRRRRSALQIADDIRRTILRLDEQRRLAADVAGRALVNQAEVRRACDEQLRTLVAAFDVAADAEMLAHRAAKGARRDGDADLAALEQTAAGMRTAQDALGLAAKPIEDLLAAADQTSERAHHVLARARAVLDEQIREQVRLLGALEAAERARIVSESRPDRS